jgi:uncharacterized membrane protein
MSQSHVVAAVVTVLTFIVIDAIWLTLVAGRMFRAALGSLLRDQPDFIAAFAFYLFYALGMIVLVLLPALRASSAGTALVLGAVLGLTAYATFDLTNMAVLRGWTWQLVVVDIAWGSALTALSCWIGVAAGLAFANR